MMRLLSDYGIAVVLLLLCIYFSAATLAERPGGPDSLAADVTAAHGVAAKVLVAAGTGLEEGLFAKSLKELLERGGASVVVVAGHPWEVKEMLGGAFDVVALSARAARWELFAKPGGPPRLSPRPRRRVQSPLR